MTDKSPTWLDKLPHLNTLLSQGGLPVGADVWIRIYDLIIARYQQQSLPENPQELQWSINGLVVTSADQQQQFTTLYQQWLDDIGYGEENPQQKQAQQLKAQKEWQKCQQAQRKNKSIWKVIALSLTLLTALAIAAYYFIPEPQPEPKPEPKEKVSKASTTTPVVKSPIALQTTPIRTDLLPKEETKPTHQQAYLLKLIKDYLPFLPAFLFLLWLLAKWLRWKEVLRQQKGDPNDPLSHISISNSAANAQQAKLFNSPGLSRALRALHNTVKQPTQQLAIQATADATARSAGYFTPVYAQRAVVPPTLLMISYQHGRDQATGLALLLQQRLLHVGLEVHTYLFQGTPQQLLPLGEERWVSLETLTHHHQQANLLLISDPDIYLSNWSGRLHPWVENIGQWKQRALLYTRRPSAAMLKSFSQVNLQCASLSSEGLRHISQQFAGVNIPGGNGGNIEGLDKAGQQPATSASQHELPAVLARLTANDCYEEPDSETQTQQIDALKHYCSSDELHLLTLIAAYPELHWVLTQRLESETFSDHSAAQREQRLLHLLHLPWLRYGQIPQWLRRYLHQQQSKQQYQYTQALYLHLFEQAQINQQENQKTNKKGNTQEQLQLPFNPNATKKHKPALIRWLTLLKQANKNIANSSIWEDQIFATTLLGKKTLDLDVILPKVLAKALPQGRWRTLYPGVAASILLSAVLGSLLHQGWKQYGNELAQNYWIRDPQLTRQLANTKISIQVTKPDSFKTGAEMVRFEQQKQAAGIVEAALEKQGFKGKISINTKPGAEENLNQPSRINHSLQNQKAAGIIARQLKHLGWGLEPRLDNGNNQADTIQIQLNQLTQTATTFSDSAHPLDAEQKAALTKPIDKENPPVMQPFTLFRDSITAKDRQQSDEQKSENKGKGKGKGKEEDSQKKVVPVPTMIVLPAGEFLMGSPEDELGRSNGESPQHLVKIKAFALSQTEITFDQYDAFAEATGRKKPDDEGWGRGQRPVINVGWNDATAYVKWLSEQTGQTYHLPSEAEWEYAARAGTTTPFSTGECIHTDLANYNGKYSYNNCGAKTEKFRGKTLPVMELPANPWGLFAMHGNVWEWVEDCWHDNYEGAPVDGTTWQQTSCDRRVVRGGGWYFRPVSIRSADRYRSSPDGAFNITGFRIARAL